MLKVVAVEVRELAIDSGILAFTEGIIPIEPFWNQRSSQPPVYEAI